MTLLNFRSVRTFIQAVASAVLVAPLIGASVAYAQSIPEGDGFGQNSLSISALSTDTIPTVSIGHSGGGLSHGITYVGDGFSTPTTESFIEVEATGTGSDHYYFVRLPGAGSIRFTADTGTPTASTVFTEFIKAGADLEFDGNDYIYTSRHGTVATFDPVDPVKPRLTSIVSPNGAKVNYYYRGNDLSSIRNSYGFQIKYQRASTPFTVSAFNMRHDYCSVSSLSCTLGSEWASGSEGVGESSVTDAAGETYTITESGSTMTLDLPVSGAQIETTYNSSGYAASSTRLGITRYNTVFERNMGTSDPEDDRLEVVMTHPGVGQQIMTSTLNGGQPISFLDALGQTTSWDYNTDRTLDKMTMPRGNRVEYTYDTRGNVTEMRRKAGPTGGGNTADLVTKAAYPASCTSANRSYCNKPTWTEDTAGNRTHYTYHSQSGQIETITQPHNGTGQPVTVYGYTQLRARITSLSGATGLSHKIWKLTSITRYSGSTSETVTTITYDADKNLAPTSVTVSGNGVSSLTTTYDYDVYGNRIAVDGPLPGDSDRVVTFYDEMGRVTGTIGADPDGTDAILRPAIRYTHNGLGMPVTVETGTATGDTQSHLDGMTVYETRTTAYDSTTLRADYVLLESGSVATSRIDYAYDTAGRIECAALRMDPAAGPATDACVAGSPTIYGFDRITKREYDAVSGRMTRSISGYGSPVSVTEEFDYWDFGPVRSAWDGNGNETYYTYDAHNRPFRTYYPNASGSGYNPTDYTQNNYNDYGWRNRVFQRDGDEVRFTFRPTGRIKAVNAPGTANDLTLSYDIVGRLLSIGKPGSTVLYGYDRFGRQTSETHQGSTVSYTYDAYGRRATMSYPGSHNFSLTYDYHDGGPLKTIKWGSTQLAEFTYDARGRRDELRRGPKIGNDYDNVTRYGYGALSRLTSLEADLSGPSISGADQLLSFTHNPAGQIVTKTSSNPIYDPWPTDYTEDFDHNGLNQITARNGSAFTYDSAGNLTASPDGSFTYDYANRLTSVTRGGNTTALTYDGASRLKSAGSESFTYAGSDMILQYTSNTLVNYYVHGPGVDEPIARIEVSGSTLTPHYYVTDHQGSIIGETQYGSAATANTYDMYGRPDTNNTGLYQYTGQVWLEDLELYYYKARFYDPKIRRFLNADPIGYADGFNMYAYVGGDPVNMRDPSGMFGTDEGIVSNGTKHDKHETSLSWDEFLEKYGYLFDTVLNLERYKAKLAASFVKSQAEKALCASIKKELFPKGREFEVWGGRVIAIKFTAGRARDGDGYLGAGIGVGWGGSGSYVIPGTFRKEASDFAGKSTDIDLDFGVEGFGGFGGGIGFNISDLRDPFNQTTIEGSAGFGENHIFSNETNGLGGALTRNRTKAVKC